MYTQIWNKYIPIIRILLKRTVNGGQTLELNRIDFERAGVGRKAGYKFTIEFVKGRVANLISGSPLASDLATAILEDAATKALMATHDYNISLNTRFQLSLVRTGSSEVTPTAEPAEAED